MVEKSIPVVSETPIVKFVLNVRGLPEIFFELILNKIIIQKVQVVEALNF